MRRWFPLFTAFWLQFAPLLVRLEPLAAPLAGPLGVLLRCFIGATAVSGAFHAVSGATGLTVTTAGGVLSNGETVPATNGAAFTARFAISSGRYGIPKAYTYLNLPPGISPVTSKPDTLQGKPTRSGNYVISVIGWEFKNATGESALFFVSIEVQGTLPVISRQPLSQTIADGSAVTFSVAATGEAPLTYQWLFGDWEIDGTGDTLTLTGVSSALAGAYRVRIDSPAGSVFSDVATLVVTNPPVPPKIVKQSGDGTVFPGETAQLSVSVALESDGTTPVITWQKDGAAVIGGGDGTLRLGLITPASGGTYQAQVRGTGGSSLSQPMHLTVAPLPIVNVVRGADGVSLEFSAVVGRKYLVQSRPGFDGVWRSLQSIQAVTNHLVVGESSTEEAGFFRVAIAPLP